VSDVLHLFHVYVLTFLDRSLLSSLYWGGVRLELSRQSDAR
jgi:hypothetical protein